MTHTHVIKKCSAPTRHCSVNLMNLKSKSFDYISTCATH
jgi:hypothetical protein